MRPELRQQHFTRKMRTASTGSGIPQIDQILMNTASRRFRFQSQICRSFSSSNSGEDAISIRSGSVGETLVINASAATLALARRWTEHADTSGV